jgi:hypothetical protein
LRKITRIADRSLIGFDNRNAGFFTPDQKIEPPTL